MPVSLKAHRRCFDRTYRLLISGHEMAVAEDGNGRIQTVTKLFCVVSQERGMCVKNLPPVKINPRTAETRGHCIKATDCN